jgi:glycosyltransferase involved in cell wall biosynthesis
MAKKVLIFSTDDFTPPAGGAEIAIREITSRLPEFEFDLICANIFKKVKFEKVKNVNIYRMGIGISKVDKYLLAFFGHLKALKLHKKNRYDVIWGMMASYGGFAAMFLKKKFSDVPFLLTLQEGDDLGYIKKKAGFLEKYFLKIFSSADYVQSISHFLANWAKENGATCPIEVIPNGVDIARFTKNFSVAALENLKNKIGKKPGEIYLVHTGRLVFKNGLDSIIRALEFLPANIKFLSIGSGADLGKLKLIAKEKNVTDRVIFIDYLHHEEMVKYLKISDIFIRPSLTEGLGNSFIEAMAAGLPTIGTPVGGIPDFLKDGETGFLCQPNDPQSIADTVNRILNLDHIKLDKIKENAFSLVSTRFNWETVSASMRKIFLTMIK